MIVGLLAKTWYEVRVTTLALGVALLGVESLLAYVLPTFFQEVFGAFAHMQIIQNIVGALLGTEMTGQLGPRLFGAVAWVHPVMLSVLWAHEIMFCTRVPVAEIDRGTIDVLLGLPVSRAAVYISEAVAFLISGVVMLTFALAGNLLSQSMLRPEVRLPIDRLMIVLANLYALYLAVGGLAFACSAMSNRRGRAVAGALSVVVGSFLLNFLAQFWEPAKSVSFLSFLTYYQPLTMLREGRWPIQDMLVLTLTGAVFWLAGAWVFCRRQICTV